MRRLIDEAVSLMATNIDDIASISCLVGAICCLYLMSIVLREKTPLVFLQRIALGILASALLSNSIFDWPEWALINGHRPTGVAVDVATTFTLLVMAVRGNLIYQPHLSATLARR